jgi:hypothetical protein
MSYGDEITASDGFEPDEDDEFGSADLDELGAEDEADWDDDEGLAGS